MNSAQFVFAVLWCLFLVAALVALIALRRSVRKRLDEELDQEWRRFASGRWE